jgi:hypothetical protein
MPEWFADFTKLDTDNARASAIAIVWVLGYIVGVSMD